MHPSLWLLLISLFLIFSPKYVFANTFLSCSIRISCGTIQDIGYPFWGLDRLESCGYPHPGFQLHCNDNVPEITILNATYRVLEINNSSQILTVSRIDYRDNICPSRLINSTFESSPFQYKDGGNIRLYYGCPTVPETLTLTPNISNPFECRINQRSMMGYYVTMDLRGTAIANYLGSCSDSVIIPAPIFEVGSLEENRNPEALEAAARLGFDLVWSANDGRCDDCLKDGGECGHNLGSGEFECYQCPESEGHGCSTRSPGDKINSVALGLGLGIPGAAIVCILVGIGIFCFRQQRRKKIAAQVNSRDLLASSSSKGPSTSTTNTSQTNSSYSTSKCDIERGSCYFGAHVFSFEELEEATDHFNPSKQLGEGGFGTVYYGVLRDGRVVAVKRLYDNNFKRVDQYMNEIEILTRIRHPNLVILYGCTSRRSRELLLVYEFIPNGTVADHLHGKRSNASSLTWHVRLSIAIETAKALAYLHASEIIHRDVKSNNILLDKSFHVKVADFGLSRLFPNDVTHVSTAPQGTPGYVDPEYHLCYQLTEKSDVYSFGVVLVELVSAKQAVDITRHRHDINLANMAISRIQNQTLHELVDPSLGFENDCAVKTAVTAVSELAFRCLQQERDMRPSMGEVLETLKEIENGRSEAEVVEIGSEAEVVEIGSEAEVVDIRSDDVGLLKNIHPPLSPDHYATDKWVSFSTITIT
ncbi:Leaf rust 10 disease-resistance locus receptor-like protein kinase-like 3 [Hibiscus trionum]|uniref:non-specific serine/threonine protein kinase n=1 Tax=Hibiscus trionum TaxID=183268 RepID=A0A9W7GX40_HIBTR|nr:Leaf rust 10 disease-resistance locus receptor-like protein kinase-like 3 [Hibiscus trionum]